MGPRFAACLLIIATLLAGCTGPTPPSEQAAAPMADSTQEGHGILEGAVVDENFIPIQGAHVMVPGRSATTAWNGQFHFLDLAPGRYPLEVSAVGWSRANIDASVQADRVTRLTIFLEPLIVAEPYSEVSTVRGEITCLDVRPWPGGQSLSCHPVRRDMGFPTDWAGLVSEFVWGDDGHSTTAQAEVRLEETSRQPAKLYAHKVGSKPIQLWLLPDGVHGSEGGRDATPAAGASAPLQLSIQKDPMNVLDLLSAGLTVQESYEVYHTTFFLEAPSNIADYSALP